MDAGDQAAAHVPRSGWLHGNSVETGWKCCHVTAGSSKVQAIHCIAGSGNLHIIVSLTRSCDVLSRASAPEHLHGSQGRLL